MGRDREHLTELEVERLIKVAKGNRHGQRDVTMILIGFRHGLRVSELCDLRWSSIAFETGTMHVRRAKGGEAATHPLLGDELRALRELKRQSASPFVFASERGGPFTPSGFANHFIGADHRAYIFDCLLGLAKPATLSDLSRRRAQCRQRQSANPAVAERSPKLWRLPPHGAIFSFTASCDRISVRQGRLRRRFRPRRGEPGALIQVAVR